MPRKKSQFESVSRQGQQAAGRTAPPTVSGRWVLTALAIVILAAVVCAWGSLCLLFWQGAWQLLYRPTSAVTRTPATVGLAFETVGFAAKDTGAPRLRGWWIPAAEGAGLGAAASQYTVLYLHDRIGNLGDSVDELSAIHAAGVNVFAFDYRGYGQSEFVHPSEARWREDAESALSYLRDTRQVPAGSTVLVGLGLGANLALEIAAAHPELAGVVLDRPLAAPLDRVFNDARAHLVPARLLFRDRYQVQSPAAELRIPSLWLLEAGTPASIASEKPLLDAYGAVTAPKMLERRAGKFGAAALERWLAELRRS